MLVLHHDACRALLTEDNQFDALRRSILQQPYQPGQDLLAGARAMNSADLSGCDLDDSSHVFVMKVSQGLRSGMPGVHLSLLCLLDNLA